ncbi:HAD family hydrolase [Bifidobacterium cebidarum]|uniref:Haloacid dehalogenase n=1 Tax=Bifidobacterium cebidarum TaxID=2650773 RepID=A0A6I1GI80_9BIFI|nr:HAD family hydrolase [Bifidobacterium cebidarum]KAB7789119.1 haloacid dehalogenase [Bifidobacterium cebidarum]
MRRMVLWDFDGTLADTAGDVWRSLDYAAKLCGGSLPETYKNDAAHLGEPMSDIFRRIEPFPGEAAFAQFKNGVTTHYRTMNDYAATRLYPGVLALLSELRLERITNVIVTDKPRQALERLLRAKGWADLFDGWASPDSIPGRQMDKTAMIGTILHRYQADANHCIYVGDRWGDIEAARRNGIDCIAVTYGDGEARLLQEHAPAYCVDDVTSLGLALKERMV